MTSDRTNDFTHLQDVLGSLPMVKRYIVICLCFALDATKSIPEIETSLRDALDRLAESFRFLAGRVIYEGRAEGSTGRPRVVSHRGNIHLIVKDHGSDATVPGTDEMRRAMYPMSMLDSGKFAPEIVSSWTMDTSDMTAPVLVLQANFVRGGLLLTFCGNHTQMDMTGLGMVIALFAKACRGAPYSTEEVQQGNQDRRHVVPLLGEEYRPEGELGDVLIDTTIRHPPSTDPSPPKWVYINISAENLVRLKDEASIQDVVPYISTDDAVAALCWQRIAKIRAARLEDDVETQFVRPLSVRKYLDLQGYMGHMVDCVYEREVDVWKRPLGEIAGRLRQILLQNDKIKHHIQAYATILQRLQDKSQMVNGARVNVDRDVILSSYANIRCCDLSFGPYLGRPEEARRPNMSASPSLLYLMPKSKQGSMAVALCLSETDLTRLRQDEILKSYADYVG